MLAEFETKPIEMNTLTMRPATLDDIPGVVEAGNACAIAQIGRPDMEADDLHNEWTSPKVNLAENMRGKYRQTRRNTGRLSCTVC